MSLTREEKDAFNRIHLIFGRPLSETKEFFESLGIYALFQYAEGREIVLPYLGTLSIKYKGDVLDKAGKKAVLETTLTPDPFIVRSVGQFHDGDTTEADKILLSRIQNIFREYEDVPPQSEEAPPNRQ